MKKLFALLLCLAMVVPALALAETEITLWTYPIGSWSKSDVVDEIVANFNAVYPDIKVKVEYLDYTSGDDQVTAAIEAGTTPDIIFEGPERLVANWGAAGKMMDISDLWTEETSADIAAAGESMKGICTAADGNIYLYPLCMTTHCMVIDKAVFEATGAMQYINEDRTWTTEQFQNAMKVLADAGYMPGIVYCGGQGGDQGTRALVYNLYSAQFANAEHTEYTIGSEAGIKGLTLLQQMANDGTIVPDPAIVAGDAIALFANGTTPTCFCWNAALLETNKASLAEGIEPYAVTFPSDDGVPVLDGGIWGFGVFDNGDENKIAASKTFINFMANSDETAKAVKTSTYFSVKNSLSDLYKDDEIMNEYQKLMPYLGDYYQVTPGWAEARTAWWNMLQQVGQGTDVTTAVTEFCNTANAAASAS